MKVQLIGKQRCAFTRYNQLVKERSGVAGKGATGNAYIHISSGIFNLSSGTI